ncbi:MAG: alpha/beta fold hydrolase [Cyclobacteriaceae bacterium]
MTYFKPSIYKSPRGLFNGHLQTIVPSLFRKVSPKIPLKREEINTPDDDFLDLDWMHAQSDKLVIVSHGLEGDSRRPYMIGMANRLYDSGYAVLLWNFRGCSGRMNKQLRMYHSGATEDLSTVVQHAASQYQKIYLVGFSLGGNLTLKYLGEGHHNQVKRATVISTPLDLKSGSIKLSDESNSMYTRRFLKSLNLKILAKHQQFPDNIDLRPLQSIKSIYEFDDIYTAPIHGFGTAEHYYKTCSSRFFIDQIRIPTLILNARNDPFFGIDIFNRNITANNSMVHYHISQQGGHCGFAQPGKYYWSENITAEFFNNSRS